MKKLLILLLPILLYCSDNSTQPEFPNNNLKQNSDTLNVDIIKIKEIIIVDSQGNYVGNIIGTNYKIYIQRPLVVTNGGIVSHGTLTGIDFYQSTDPKSPSIIERLLKLEKEIKELSSGNDILTIK